MPPRKGTPAYEAWAQTDSYQQWRVNMSLARKGHASEAQKQNGRKNILRAQEARKASGFWFSPESREKMSATRRAKAEALLGPAGIIPESRRCNRCGQVKAASEFTFDRQKRDCLRRTCRQCEKELRAETADQRRRNRIIKTYGVDPDWFDRTFQAQSGRCAICREKLTQQGGMAVDHNHDTGAVRGLLCSLCNSGLGMFRDRPRLLTAAAKYLRRAEGGDAQCASRVAAFDLSRPIDMVTAGTLF